MCENCNTGDCNTGNRNTGVYNAGDYNTGNRNVGDWNTGHDNSGSWNTGNYNIGDGNTGSVNTGVWNTGYGNIGNANTGNRNIGHRNTGDWNKSSFNTGCFNTEEQKITLFNKPSDMTYSEWLVSDAKRLLDFIPDDIELVHEKDMTEEEKEKYQVNKTTGECLKEVDRAKCRQSWWDNLSEEKKNVIKAIPNFDAKIFYECTGIKVTEENKK